MSLRPTRPQPALPPETISNISCGELPFRVLWCFTLPQCLVFLNAFEVLGGDSLPRMVVRQVKPNLFGSFIKLCGFLNGRIRGSRNGKIRGFAHRIVA